MADRLSSLTIQESVVTSDPEVMSGAFVFRGTRVLAQTLLDYVASGDSIEDFLDGFPSVSREQALAFLEQRNRF